MGRRQMRDALTNTISVYAKQAPGNDRAVLDKLESCRWVKPAMWEMASTRELQGIHFLPINLAVFHQEVSVRGVKGWSQAPLSHSYLRVACFDTWLFPEQGDCSSPPNVFKEQFLAGNLYYGFETKPAKFGQLLQILRSELILCIIHRLSYVGFPRVCYYT